MKNYFYYATKKLYPRVFFAQRFGRQWQLSGKEKSTNVQSKNDPEQISPICLQNIPMDRRRSEMYGTVRTKISFVFAFEVYRYKVGQNL